MTKPTLATEQTQPDWVFRGILILILSVAVWVLLMPWVPSIAAVTMRRFHLSSDSFIGFAIQQPIPAMYNFSNRVEVRDLDPLDPILDLIEPVVALPILPAPDSETMGLPLGVVSRETINHFPLRRLTFADGQYKYLRNGARWLNATTDYRGRRLTTRWHIGPGLTGGEPWVLERQAIEWSASP